MSVLDELLGGAIQGDEPSGNRWKCECGARRNSRINRLSHLPGCPMAALTPSQRYEIRNPGRRKKR